MCKKYQIFVEYAYLYTFHGMIHDNIFFRISDDLDDEANEFSYDVQDRIMQKLKSVEYVRDKDGNRLRNSYKNLAKD